MPKLKTIEHYRSNSGNAPAAQDLKYGEIAIGYKKGKETIYFKNDSNEVIGISYTAENLINITYAELKTLRTNKALIPGNYYRITDFVTTVANNSDTRSAGHAFDVIVLATDVNALQEEAFATHHEGDTYFTNCQLSAWKVWYCLDNDINRFGWADTTNGKGVIYRLIDEFNNDCPYDFKNVQFKRCKVTSTKITDLNNTYVGISGVTLTNLTNVTSDTIWCYTFSKRKLENNVWTWQIEGDLSLENKTTYLSSYSTVLSDAQCVDNVIKDYYTALPSDKTKSVLTLNNIVFLGGALISGPSSQNGFRVYHNTFGDGCYNMSFIGSIFDNSFEKYCFNNSFGNNCYRNSFGNYNYGNSFGNDCNSNSFEKYCYNNSFGNNCFSNSFEKYCYSNSFGNSCYRNSFGNNCNNNSLGYYCYSNSFGNDCYSNSFGYYCQNNSFGNNCNNNSLGYYFQNNTLGNNVVYINVPSQRVYNTNILNGTKGTNNSNKLTITFETEKNYSQFAGFDSEGKLRIWVDADFDVISTTYANLKSLRSSSKLIPGRRYRITDFVTTVANDPEARSANHPFDIIVLATDTNTLQEEAFAAPHEGDTYFKNCKLSAWKVWYCLDNDVARFQWADATNGKGVIYRLVDEFNNDCPYDFKNVQFKRYKVQRTSEQNLDEFMGWLNDGSSPMYFGMKDSSVFKTNSSDFKWKYTFNTLVETDASVSVNKPISFTYAIPSYPYNNVIKPNIAVINEDGDIKNNVIYLNNIVFLDYFEDNDIQEDFAFVVYGNTFGSNCHSMTLGRKCYNNTFGNDCNNNSFGNNCHDNLFGNCFQNNTLGIDCNYNTFGNSCQSNTFGCYCDNNKLGNSFDNNKLGDSCNYNIFGNDCANNMFGNSCAYNTFGNNFRNNNLGNRCNCNIFGNNCTYNRFLNDFNYNTLGNEVQYINVPGQSVYRTNILNGTKGTSDSNRLIINFASDEVCSQFAGFDSDGELQVWVEANLGDGIINGGSY